MHHGTELWTICASANGLFHNIPLLRAIEIIAKARGRRLRIFEIGPGSGYLGAYLINAGHTYAAVDVTQALYLWQNRLFSEIAADGSEWILDAGFDAKCIHVPWWQYARFYEKLPITADLVICDAALAEMEDFGFAYNVQIALKMVSGSDCGALLLQEVGEQRMRSLAAVEHHLDVTGFAEQFKAGGVSIFALPGRLNDVFPSASSDLPCLGAAAEKRLTPKTFLSFREEELLESYRFFNFLGWGL